MAAINGACFPWVRVQRGGDPARWGRASGRCRGLGPGRTRSRGLAVFVRAIGLGDGGWVIWVHESRVWWQVTWQGEGARGLGVCEAREGPRSCQPFSFHGKGDAAHVIVRLSGPTGPFVIALGDHAACELISFPVMNIFCCPRRSRVQNT